MAFIGFLYALGSFMFNGSFPLLNKIDRVAKTNVDPLIFNIYFSLGIVISSFICLIYLLIAGDTFVFTSWGILAGFFIVAAGFCTFLAIPRIGVCVGSGIWCGTAAVTAYFEGFIKNVVNGDSSDNGALYVSFPGIALVVLGIILVALCEEFSRVCFPKDKKHTIQSTNDEEAEYNKLSDEEDGITITSQSYIYGGYVVAVLTGLFGGSVGFPSTFAPEEASMIKFIPSFGCGALLAFPLSAIALYGKPNRWYIQECLLPGVIAGVLWNAGNILSIYAIDKLGYSMAYPIMQSSLLLTQMLGIVLFQEIQDQKALMYLTAGAILVIGGNVLIGLAKDL